MNTKKLLALVLVLALVICTLPVVFAEVAQPETPKDEDIGMNPSDVPADDEEEEPVILYGDANGDSSIDVWDFQDLMTYLKDPVNTEIKPGGDANGDGSVDVWDFQDLMTYLKDPNNVTLGPKN